MDRSDRLHDRPLSFGWVLALLVVDVAVLGGVIGFAIARAWR